MSESLYLFIANDHYKIVYYFTYEDCEADEISRPTTADSLTADQSYVSHQKHSTTMVTKVRSYNLTQVLALWWKYRTKPQQNFNNKIRCKNHGISGTEMHLKHGQKNVNNSKKWNVKTKTEWNHFQSVRLLFSAEYSPLQLSLNLSQFEYYSLIF